MSAVVADTHALVWYLLDQRRLSPGALRALDQAAEGGAEVVISAVTIVELVYLVEKGRLPEVLLDRVYEQLGLADAALVVAPLDEQVASALRRVPRSEVPDMPDRIIAATALHLGVPLVSRDAKIRTSGLHTVW